MRNLVLGIFLSAFVTLGAVSPADRVFQPEEEDSQDQEGFPLTIGFECPRNFGFHIGDEIPLTVTLEAEKGTVVDLVNLPKKNDRHGPFEVRDVCIRKRRDKGKSIYTILYLLQSFTPAVAVDRLVFPPLQISYATQEDWNPVESRYRYHGLFSQPFDIFVSRTATYFGPMKDAKGPEIDRWAVLQWKLSTLTGSILVLLASITWPWEL